MMKIQGAIIECMEATLSEIKRSNTYVRFDFSFLSTAACRAPPSLRPGPP